MDWALVGVIVVLCVLQGFISLQQLRTVNEIAERHSAQVDRLLVMFNSESAAEFAALNRQLETARREQLRGAIVGGEPPAEVARMAPPRSNRLGIWSREKRPVTQDKE